MGVVVVSSARAKALLKMFEIYTSVRVLRSVVMLETSWT